MISRGSLISLKKYLDEPNTGFPPAVTVDPAELLPAAIAAFRSALHQMGNCSLDACPALGDALKQALKYISECLPFQSTPRAFAEAAQNVQEHLHSWGRAAASHHEQQAGEVKEILILMARTAESVGERDQRCARQIHEVTARLQRVANLDDLTQIRVSIATSARELKASVDRMTAEGHAAIEQLRSEVSTYQSRLEEAELVATKDALTGLRNRAWVESQIARRIAAQLPLCVAIIDLDDFKQVNDDHGHLIGDDLLKQFATELKSACRSSDIIGRWGGDEFILLLDCTLGEAQAQTNRLREWVCGDYTLPAPEGTIKFHLNASIGLAEHAPGEAMTQLLARADAEMYKRKYAARAKASAAHD
jgi:diguanylate cyclase (GGDEF)-like protein